MWVVSSILILLVAAVIGREIFKSQQYRRRVSECPHPDHRVFIVQHAWCDECHAELELVDDSPE